MMRTLHIYSTEDYEINNTRYSAHHYLIHVLQHLVGLKASMSWHNRRGKSKKKQEKKTGIKRHKTMLVCRLNALIS